MELKLGIFNQTGAVYYDDFKLTKNGGPEQYIEQPSFEMNQDTIEYTYDGNGNRYSKQQIKPGNSIDETLYHNDKDGNIVSETRNLSDGSEETVRYVRDLGGKAISMLQGAKTYYFIYNAHGDVTSLTDENGDTVATYEYDEFGNLESSGSGVEGSEIYNPLRYSGANNAYFDEETGLYKMGARYQNSETGRWLTRDDYEGEQEASQSQNRYVYVENNPINMQDSTGFWADTLHHSMTFVYAARAGFRGIDALRIADENLEFDWVHNAFIPTDYKYHFNDMLYPRYRTAYKTRVPWRYSKMRRGDTRAKFAYRKLLQAVRERKKRKGNAYRKSLGWGLHSVQDTYSHMDARQHVYGKYKREYDNPYSRKFGKWRYQYAQKATYFYLTDFRKILRRKFKIRS